jgi:hypothetical protein
MRNQNRANDLPDLGARNEIVAENIRAAQVIYSAAMLEELKVFQVVDRLSQLFQLGLLTVNRRSTGSSLYKYFKEAPVRLGEVERRTLYATTIGATGGVEGAVVNREFNDLWLRFVSRVSSFTRQKKIDAVDTAVGESNELALRRAARDLAQNLSLHGGGMAFYAAVDIQKQIAFGLKLLSDTEITSAYGARDLWQVVDQVATIDLGGTANTNRYRTMAIAGATIMSWLAANSTKIQNKNTKSPLIKIRTSRPRQNELLKIALKPTDDDLLNSCEQWLLVSGISDEQIETFAQPRPEARLERSKTAR